MSPSFLKNRRIDSARIQPTKRALDAMSKKWTFVQEQNAKERRDLYPTEGNEPFPGKTHLGISFATTLCRTGKSLLLSIAVGPGLLPEPAALFFCLAYRFQDPPADHLERS
jgi:hypothetical protein